MQLDALNQYVHNLGATDDALSGFNCHSYIERKCALYGPQQHIHRHNPDGTEDLLALPCLTLACRRCAENIILPALRSSIEKAIDEHGLDQHLTLTMRRRGPADPVRRSKELARAWSRLTRAYAKKFGHAMPYIWVKEMKSDWPHRHVVTTGCRKRWLKDTWHALTGAHQVQVIPITDAARTAAYLTKSIHDNARCYGSATGRWRGSSKGIRIPCRPKPAASNPEKGKWQFHKTPLTRELCDARGAEVLRTDYMVRPVAAVIRPADIHSARPVLPQGEKSSRPGKASLAPCGTEPREVPHPRVVGTPGRLAGQRQEASDARP